MVEAAQLQYILIHFLELIYLSRNLKKRGYKFSLFL